MTTSGVTQFAEEPLSGTINGVHLYDVIDQTELTAALEARHVREQTHPSEPLAILNYTEMCAVTPGAWNPTTLACRGLIYRSDTGEVVARGYVKFFNHGQAGAPVLDMDASVLVTDKKDGSLGIIYPVPSGGWAVATRGSFASEQAIHATRVLAERYPAFRPEPTVTALVEIVYPQNRIVLDYAGLDDLILLGGQPLLGDRPVPPASMQTATGWPGPVTETLMVGSFAEALAMPTRANAEGVVVHDLVSGSMVKIKEEAYVALHRIVTNLTARKVHEHMLTGASIVDFIAPLPDEFHTWCVQTADGITALVDAEDARLGDAFENVRDQVIAKNVGWRAGDRAARKDFAMIAARHPDSWALFALLDGRDIRPELLKRAQPGPFLTPTGRTYTEDNA